MSTILTTDGLLQPLTPTWLDTITAIENSAHPHPWSRGNFSDALQAGYHGEILLRNNQALGYFVAMQVLDEIHLLTITVTPTCQGQGWARVLLDGLRRWGRSLQARTLWLEVRESNTRALAVYERYGFVSVGLRKNYYPPLPGSTVRESALIMNMVI